ncbi:MULTISPECIES: hypothetical protein [Halomonadaceae]|uniref:Uncharacterized protein n=1 Tax=Vreelandella titanicae TaxID=664683 RepID=A0AAP9T0H0_9GAMM|nr:MULTISPECIES: hypothetical protein [Halomonas]QKS24230.1 hypothetical protein FX987_02004 [Halomonas titanicae]CDG54526.1 hypothetical protein HALA3H3_790005 [Halomonas sp. A3H3]SDI31280.1 hypothetical protein SAMN04487867_104224 [Halomonas titanicae]
MYGTDKDSVVVNGLLQCLVNIGNEVGVSPEEQLNGSLEIIAAIRKLKGERDALTAHVKRLTKAADALTFGLVHDSDPAWKPSEVTESAFSDVMDATSSTPEASCLHRDLLNQSEGMRKAARIIEQKANAYDEEHGSTDPTTGTREYPGNGDEYYNELMELSDELRQQADGGA